MINLASFTITGRIGKVHDTGKIAYISIATDYQTRDEQGEWHDNTDWNSVTVFPAHLRKRLGNSAGRAGNLVQVHGRIKSASYEKDGKTHYTTDLIATGMEVLHFARRKEEQSE